MYFIFFLIFYIENGHEYDSADKKTLIQVEKSTVDLIIEQKVEKISAGSTGESAFFLCRSVIRSVSFEENSRLKEIGDFLFQKLLLKKLISPIVIILLHFQEVVFQNVNILLKLFFRQTL